MTKLEWAVFYEGGEIFTSSNGAPCDCPQWGVVAVAQTDEGTGVLPLVGDYFSFHSGRWWNHDFIGLIDTLVHKAQDVSVVRVGRYVSNNEFAQILAKIASIDLPPRSALRPRESR